MKRLILALVLVIGSFGCGGESRACKCRWACNCPTTACHCKQATKEVPANKCCPTCECKYGEN